MPDILIKELREEISTLREQVEKLTKERDEALERERNCAIATHRKAYCIQQCASIIGPDTSATIDGLPKAVKRVTEKLAALAEQNERQKEALLYVMRATVLAYDDKPNSPIGWVYKVASDAYELPNHATPVMNRIRAEGMREAEKIVRKRVQWVSNGQGIQYRSTAPEPLNWRRPMDDRTMLELAKEVADTVCNEIGPVAMCKAPISFALEVGVRLIELVKVEKNEAIIAAANALENIASTSSSTRIRRVANDALTAIRASRNHG